MSKTATYTATLMTRQYNQTANTSTSYAAQDYPYEGENKVGVISFSGLDMTGRIINGISLTITSASAGLGQWYTKTAYLHKSNYQNTTQSGVTGLQYVGDSLGSLQGNYRDNTLTFTLADETGNALLTNMAAYLTAGHNTFTVYNPNPHPDLPGRQYSESYFKWTSVSITIDYDEGASKPTTSASTVALGSAITINTNRASSAQTHTIRYAFGGASDTIATNVGASTSWTPPASLASQIPSDVSGVCTIYCDTYYNGALTGTKSCTITLGVPSSTVPTVQSVTAQEGASDIPQGITAYIQNFSKPVVTIVARGVYGSTPTQYRATLDGRTYTGTTFTTSNDIDYTAQFTASAPLAASGSVEISVTVTDTRGRVSQAGTATITALAYSKPTITSFSAERCNDTGTEAQTDGTHVRINLSARASSLNDGTADQNAILTCAIQHRLKGASSWTTDDQLSPVDFTVSETNRLLTASGAVFQDVTSYEIRIVFADKFYQVEQQAEIGTKVVIMDFLRDGNGVAFGKVAEESGVVEFNWPLKMLEPLGIADGGTGADNATDALNTLGALKRTTDTFTGELTIANTGSVSQMHMTPQQAASGRLGFARIDAAANGYFGFYAFSGEGIGTYRALWVNNPAYQTSLDNALYLRTNEGGAATNYKVFHSGMANGVPVSSGGTGATTAADARANLGANDASNITTGTLDMDRMPVKIAHGHGTVGGTSETALEINYSSIGFDEVPHISVTYSKEGANVSGDNGIPKVYEKTTAGAKVILSGSGTREIDWIAIGV